MSSKVSPGLGFLGGEWTTEFSGRRVLLGLVAALIAALIAVASASAADLPRVVSMNLCTDQMVLLLADPDQITSLSRLARDPRSSSLAQEASAHPQNAGGAEEIYLSAPDLVLAGQYSDKATLAMLRPRTRPRRWRLRA